MTGPRVTRRRTLQTLGAVAAGGLAGCSTDAGGGQPATDGRTTDSRTPTTSDEPAALALRTVATGFDAPLDFANAPDSDLRYVADQTGVISVVGPDGNVETFLDLASENEVVTGGEQGLLGLALHPDFSQNRRLFVRYSSPPRSGTPSNFSHTFVLSEFVADADGEAADPDSERVLLEIPEPQSNHNSGAIVFGSDGYLYVGVGDGGEGGDVGTGHVEDWYEENEGGNGQDVDDNLLGSILRIDVDTEGRGRPYGIPEDNPLVGEAGLDEQYAWGFRNPWRMSFDGEDLYVGDVGESDYEEVDLVQRGGNYGWNVKEATHCFEADDCPDETPEGEPLIDPIIEYPHSGGPVSGISVIGGYVYRGDDIRGLAGTYVFGDLNAEGRLFLARRPPGTTESANDGLWPTSTVPVVEEDAGKLQQLLSFGRDREDRLFALCVGEDNGGVYELQPAG